MLSGRAIYDLIHVKFFKQCLALKCSLQLALIILLCSKDPKGMSFCLLKAEPQRLRTLSKGTPKKMVKPFFKQKSRNLSSPALHAFSLSRANEFPVLEKGSSLFLVSLHQRGLATWVSHNEGCTQMKPCLCISWESSCSPSPANDTFLGLVPLCLRLLFCNHETHKYHQSAQGLFPGGPQEGSSGALHRQGTLGQMKAGWLPKQPYLLSSQPKEPLRITSPLMQAPMIGGHTCCTTHQHSGQLYDSECQGHLGPGPLMPLHLCLHLP